MIDIDQPGRQLIREFRSVAQADYHLDMFVSKLKEQCETFKTEYISIIREMLEIEKKEAEEEIARLWSEFKEQKRQKIEELEANILLRKNDEEELFKERQIEEKDKLSKVR